MKKIVLAALICSAMLLSSCGTQKASNDQLPKNTPASTGTASNSVQAEATLYSQSYMGTWYGFGTDGSDAQFEIKISPKLTNVAWVELSGWGSNSSAASETYDITFSSAERAETYIGNGNKRVFEFSNGSSADQSAKTYLIDANTNSQISETMYMYRQAYRSNTAGSAGTAASTSNTGSANTGSTSAGNSVTAQSSSANTSAKNGFQSRYDQLSRKEIPEASQTEMNVQSYELYQEWDSLLNDVYQYLKSTLPSGEFESLKQSEISWIKEKEAAIEAARSEMEGGTGAPLLGNAAGIDYTQKRCEYLISLIR